MVENGNSEEMKMETTKEHGIDVLQGFIANGINVNIKDKNGTAAIIYASAKNNIDSVRLLLDNNANVNVQNVHGCSPLSWACLNGHAKIVELLLEKNVNADFQDNGETALICASQRGFQEIVQSLLNHGVDVESKNGKGQTAFDLASTEEIKELLRNYAINNSYVLK